MTRLAESRLSRRVSVTVDMGASGTPLDVLLFRERENSRSCLELLNGRPMM